MMHGPPSQTVFFEPAPDPEKCSGPLDLKNLLTGEPSTLVGKKAFVNGVAMAHAFLLFSIFIPCIMLCVQMSRNVDLDYFVGVGVAQLSYLLMAFIIMVPMMHFFMSFSPWFFLLSMWIPGFGFAGIGMYYWSESYVAVNALRSSNCTQDFLPKAELQISYNSGQDLYHACHAMVIDSIEDCVQYDNVYDMSPEDFAYLQGLERRFQCAGICNSGVRLWEQAGTSAPACGLFVAEWVNAASKSSQLMLWYSAIVVVVSVSVWILLLDNLLKDYYTPLAGEGKINRDGLFSALSEISSKLSARLHGGA
jgi:hypothetical protein